MGSHTLAEPSERDRTIIAMVGSGKTIAALARDFGLSRQRVDQILERWAPELHRHRNYVVPRPAAFRHPPKIVAEVRARWSAGDSAALIAERLTERGYPITRNAVIGLAHRNDFPARPSPIQKRV